MSRRGKPAGSFALTRGESDVSASSHGSADQEVDRTRGDRIGGSPEAIPECIRDRDARVGDRLQEQALPRWAGEVALAWRSDTQRGRRLSVPDGEVAARLERHRDGLLVAGLGVVAALVEALIDGGSVIHGQRDLHAARAGPQPDLLEANGQGAGSRADAL